MFLGFLDAFGRKEGPKIDLRIPNKAIFKGGISGFAKNFGKLIDNRATNKRAVGADTSLARRADLACNQT